MEKLTIESLKNFRQKARAQMANDDKTKITVHMGTCGIASGAEEVLEAVRKEIELSKSEDILISTTGCAGLCSREPMMTVKIPGKPPVKYVDLDAEKISVIFKEHVLKDSIVSKYALAIGNERIHL